MRSVAMLLTALLAVLLTAIAPAAVERCCLPRPKCSSCCAGKCDCHLTTPTVPQPAAQTPATLQANADVLLPVFASNFLVLPLRVIAAPTGAVASPDTSPPYVLTHAFLI